MAKMAGFKIPFKNKSKGKELYDTIQEYSEYSTVAGILYIFMPQQTTAGKLFWVFVILSMLALSIYWSAVLYFQWEGQTDNPMHYVTIILSGIMTVYFVYKIFQNYILKKLKAKLPKGMAAYIPDAPPPPYIHNDPCSLPMVNLT